MLSLTLAFLLQDDPFRATIRAVAGPNGVAWYTAHVYPIVDPLVRGALDTAIHQLERLQR